MRIIISSILAILAVISIVLFNTYGWVILAMVVSYLIFSFGTLKVDEVGMMTVFDKPIEDVKKGVYFAPLGIVSVRKESGLVFQDELPADPEKIFREDGKVPDGMFPPIRVKFGQPNPKDVHLKDDPYNIAIVAEVVPVVSWHIVDPITFFKVMGNTENCRKIMADKAVELFGDKFAKITPAKATLALHKISQQLENKLRAETTTWGIDINDAYVKPIVFSHSLNSAVESVSREREGAKALVLKAEGEKGSAILAAEGAKQAAILVAQGERERLIATGQAVLNSNGSITLLPDAKTKAQTEALGKLSEVKGTVVLGQASTMLGISSGKE